MKPLSERQTSVLLTIALWSMVILISIVSVFILRHTLSNQEWNDFPPPVHRFYYATWIGVFCAWRLIWGRVPVTVTQLRKASSQTLVLLLITVWMSLMYFAATHHHSPRIIGNELSNLFHVFAGFGVTSLVMMVSVYCYDEELEQFLKSFIPKQPAPAVWAVKPIPGHPIRLDEVDMHQMGLHNDSNGKSEVLAFWCMAKDLQKYGDLWLSRHNCNLRTLAERLHQRGYVMYCGQEVAIFPMRDTEGQLIGIEVRVGRVPPQYTTI